MPFWTQKFNIRHIQLPICSWPHESLITPYDCQEPQKFCHAWGWGVGVAQISLFLLFWLYLLCYHFLAMHLLFWYHTFIHCSLHLWCSSSLCLSLKSHLSVKALLKCHHLYETLFDLSSQNYSVLWYFHFVLLC